MECKHRWIIDKSGDFAYCDKCFICIKDGKTYTKEEYIKEFPLTPQDSYKLANK